MTSRATVHMFKRRISIFTCLVAVTGLITVCAASETEGRDIRTPHIFLRAVHEIVDMGDLANYGFVAKMLNLELRISSTKEIKSDIGEKIGTNIKFEIVTDSANWFDVSLNAFYYVDIKLDDRNFKRVILSTDVNQRTICVKLEDVINEFGVQINQTNSTDLGPITYSYGFNKYNTLALAVRFDKNRCMSSLMLSQNTARN